MIKGIGFFFRHSKYWIQNKIEIQRLRRTVIPKILGLHAKINTIRLINGRKPNARFFNLETSEQAFVVKTHAGSARINREVKTSEILKKIHFVHKPRLVGHYKNYLINEYIDGIPLSYSMKKESSDIVDQAMAKVMNDVYKVHQALPIVDSAELTYVSQDEVAVGCEVDRYVNELSALDISLVDVSKVELKGILAEIDKDSIIKDYSMDSSSFALIHGDLIPANIIINNSGIPYFIDWEFVRAGSIWDDLASLMTNMDISQRDKYLSNYLENGTIRGSDISLTLSRSKGILKSAIIFRLLKLSSIHLKNFKKTKMSSYRKGLVHYLKSLIQEVNNR